MRANSFTDEYLIRLLQSEIPPGSRIYCIRQTIGHVWADWILQAGGSGCGGSYMFTYEHIQELINKQKTALDYILESL